MMTSTEFAPKIDDTVIYDGLTIDGYYPNWFRVVAVHHVDHGYFVGLAQFESNYDEEVVLVEWSECTPTPTPTD